MKKVSVVDFPKSLGKNRRLEGFFLVGLAFVPYPVDWIGVDWMVCIKFSKKSGYGGKKLLQF